MPTTAPVIKGATGMTLVSTARRTTRKYGPQEVYIYEGPRAAAATMEAANASMEDFDDVALSYRGAKGIVELTMADPDNTNNPDTSAVWELDAQEVFLKLLESPYFDEATGAFWDYVPLIEAAILKKAAYDTTGMDVGYKGIVDRYQALRRRGVEGFPIDMPIVRKTWTQTSRSATRLPDCLDVGQVIPFAKIKAPDWIGREIRALPQRTYGAAVDPKSYTITSGQYEWLKKMPKKKSINRGRQTEVTQEWWGALKWSTVGYGRDATWDPTT